MVKTGRQLEFSTVELKKVDMGTQDEVARCCAKRDVERAQAVSRVKAFDAAIARGERTERRLK